MLSQLAKDISHLDYVVQRNWDNLPETYEVDGHGDLDLFVSDEHRLELEDILKKYDLPVDVRSPMDDYYPDQIGKALLIGRRLYNGFYIPSVTASFCALYYHGVVHKEKNPYDQKLKQLFLRWFPPIKARDPGVGYYV